MRFYTTRRGKDIEIYPEGNAWKVQFSQGGELPVELSGLFTSEGFASQAVENYLNKDKPRSQQNAA